MSWRGLLKRSGDQRMCSHRWGSGLETLGSQFIKQIERPGKSKKNGERRSSRRADRLLQQLHPRSCELDPLILELRVSF